MIRHPHPQGPSRSGAVAIESAFVVPLALFLILGLIVGAHGIFAYQEVASLAREGARYASVRGTRYEASTPHSVPTAQEVYENAIRPKIVSLNEANLTYDISWPYGYRPDNPVIVKLEYTWMPGVIFGDLVFKSTSVKTITW